MTDEIIAKKIQDALDILGEFFDSSQIMVSWDEAGMTKCRFQGSGNWYSRQGMAHEFITSNAAQDHAYELNKVLNRGESTDGDDWKSK